MRGQRSGDGTRGYSLPFSPDAKVIELGGDAKRPFFRPNLNVMEGPGVDIVCDLNEPFPVETEAYDGVFGQFVLEHIRHATVRQFISEVHRILRPGGVAVMITANLLEQARRLVEAQEWSDDLVFMVFGGNPDYPGNYHHTGFSPEFAARLFVGAGFHRVEVFPHPCPTDMIIQGRKGWARISRTL